MALAHPRTPVAHLFGGSTLAPSHLEDWVLLVVHLSVPLPQWTSQCACCLPKLLRRPPKIMQVTRHMPHQCECHKPLTWLKKILRNAHVRGSPHGLLGCRH